MGGPPFPDVASHADLGSVAAVIEGRTRDLGGFSVRRVLPAAEHRLVGPFIFFDHFGPVAFPAGGGIDVRPHPHINLATVTYLFEGEIVHRDSLGRHQAIRPGDVNWMTAGAGIVHSERTSPERRASGGRSHGIQLWLGLPTAHEETAPAFHHHPAAGLPPLFGDGIELRLLAGRAWDMTSPVETFSPLFYADVQMKAGSEVRLPAEHAERAAYVVSGTVASGGRRVETGRMIVFSPGVDAVVRAENGQGGGAGEGARVMLLGGAPLDGERHIYWNFVSSRKERLEQAKHDWREGRFPKVPGDEVEFIPLPD